jgi:pectate lyase
VARAWKRSGLLRASIGVGAALALLIGVVVTTAHAATLFSDDFEDGNTTGWTRSGGSWSVVTDGSRVLRQASTSSDARDLAGSSSWTTVSVQACAKALSFNGTDRFFALLARVQGATSYYYLMVRSSNRVELKKLGGGSSTLLASAPFTVSTGTFYTLRLEAAGTQLRGFVNGAQLVAAADGQFSAGRVGVATFNASAEFDDVLVTDSVPPASTTSTSTAAPTGSTSTSTAAPTGSTSTSTTRPPQQDPGLVGFATVNALGQNGTTSGSGGPTVTVSNATDFLAAIAQPGPLFIRVQGMIALPGPMHDVTSDKTIVGVGASSGFTGGGLNVGACRSTTPSPRRRPTRCTTSSSATWFSPTRRTTRSTCRCSPTTSGSITTTYRTASTA